MRLMTLDEMLDELRAEARLSQNVGHGLHTVDAHRKLLRRIQEELYDNHEWPVLKTTRTVALDAGQRYAAYPADMALPGIEYAYTRQGNSLFVLLHYGIGVDELNTFDSDADGRDFPIRRWQNFISPSGETVNQNMFEVWPVPSRPAVVRFSGKRKLFPLIEGGDTSTLDGPLIVMHAAVEILSAQKAEDAALKLQKAQERMNSLKRRQTMADNRPLNLAGGARRFRPRPGIDYIP